MAAKHGGNIRELLEKTGLAREALIDFSASINPLGPPSWLRGYLSRQVSALLDYPDAENRDLRAKISEFFSVPEDRIVVGNGTTELIYAAARLLPAGKAIIPVPCYGDYEEAALRAGFDVTLLKLKESDNFKLDFTELERVLLSLEGKAVVFIGHPNNPTGLTCDEGELKKIIGTYPDSVFCIDEAFADFIPDFKSTMNWDFPNTITLRSFTKFYAVPGIRLGFTVASSSLSEKLGGLLPTWSVNTFAQGFGKRALEDEGYRLETVEYVSAQREKLFGDLLSLGVFIVFPGKVNYLLIKRKNLKLDMDDLADNLLSEGIAVRRCGSFKGLNGEYLRLAVRREEENEKLVEKINDYLVDRGLTAGPSVNFIRKRKTPAVMFQGTSSNAGKSVLTAAMCRVMIQDGYAVAPFKAQNMALNSYVTEDGGEMGRAQVVQAQASRIAPDVRMNPILLKPSSDTGSQIIVKGTPLGNMEAKEYYRQKKNLLQTVYQCYDSLAAEYDAVVLEGAGSPGEVNLKKHDIVNMTMSRYAGAPVFIVGDIDRGGVFASFIGTLSVMEEWERQLVAGFLVNKFRGDKDLLKGAFEYVKDFTGKEVFGTVPVFSNLSIPEEDSVTFKEEIGRGIGKKEGAEITIAVIDVPHISNFTDFDPFKIEPDVNLYVVSTVKELDALGRVDAIFLPGSKNVISDMETLRVKGFAAKIEKLLHEGETEIVGICGGFQMIGGSIHDPLNIESNAKSSFGLSLMPIDTILEKDKTLTRKSALHAPSGITVSGYEIHHGKTIGKGALAIFTGEKEEVLGLGRDNGLVWGTYLHGVFDDDKFRRWFIDGLRKRKALAPLKGGGARYDIESSLNKLADIFRENVDVKRIYSLMGL